MSFALKLYNHLLLSQILRRKLHARNISYYRPCQYTFPRGRSIAQMQDLKVGTCDLKTRNQCKIISAVCVFISVSGSFIDFDAYLKSLIHLLELQIRQDFPEDFVSFNSFLN